MVMVVSTASIEPEFRTKRMYGWETGKELSGDLLTPVKNRKTGKVENKMLSKSKRARERRNQKLEALLAKLAKRQKK